MTFHLAKGPPFLFYLLRMLPAEQGLSPSCLLSSLRVSHLLRVPLHDAAVKGGGDHHGQVRVP